jgi:RimJ/RimL family protein N-acetyltransferase
MARSKRQRMSVVDLERSLKSARLTLEPIVPEHAPLLFDQLDDDRLWRFMIFRLRPRSVEGLRKRFARYAARTSPEGDEIWLNYALRRADGSYVGTVQATVAGSHAMIGYSIFADHWRQGYGKEACSELLRSLHDDFGVRTVEATVDTENVASIRLLEVLGFVRVWTGPSEDMPGRIDHRYAVQWAPTAGAASTL